MKVKELRELLANESDDAVVMVRILEGPDAGASMRVRNTRYHEGMKTLYLNVDRGYSGGR